MAIKESIDLKLNLEPGKIDSKSVTSNLSAITDKFKQLNKAMAVAKGAENTKAFGRANLNKTKQKEGIIEQFSNAGFSFDKKMTMSLDNKDFVEFVNESIKLLTDFRNKTVLIEKERAKELKKAEDEITFQEKANIKKRSDSRKRSYQKLVHQNRMEEIALKAKYKEEERTAKLEEKLILQNEKLKAKKNAEYQKKQQEEIKKSIQNSISRYNNLEKSFSKVYSSMNRITKGFVKTLSSIPSKLKIIGKSLSNTVFAPFSKTFGKIVSLTSKVLKRLGNQIVRRLAMNIVKEFEGAFTASIESLYKYSESVNSDFYKAMDKIQTNIVYIRNSMISMLSNVFDFLTRNVNKSGEQITSILDKVTDKIVYVFNQLNIIMAKLMGKSTYTQAVKASQKYSDNFSNASKSAKDMLGSYDKLNVISQDTSSESDDFSSMFEIKNIEEESGSFIDTLVQAIENSDLTTIGTIVGEKIKSALDSIKWEDIKEKINNIVKSFATFINGLVNVQGLGEKIGSNISEIFNTISSAINKWSTELKWEDIGKFINESIHGFLDNFDAKQFGESLYNLANGIFTLLSEIFGDETLWNDLGIVIGEMFGALNIPDLVNKLYEFAKTIVEAIRTALSSWAETDPESFGIAKAILIAIGAIKVLPLVSSILEIFTGKGLLSTLFTTILPAIGTFITGTLIPGIVGLLPNSLAFIIQGLITLAGQALSALGTFILGSLPAIAIAAVAALIIYLAKCVIDNWDSSKSIGENLINGICVGITNIISGIGNFLKKFVFDPIVNAIKSLFGIHSPSTEMAEIGTYIMEGLKEGLLSVIQSILDTITEISDMILGEITTIVEGIGTLITTVSQVVVDALTPILDMISNFIAITAPALVLVIDAIGNAISLIIDSIGTNIVNVINATTNLLETVKGNGLTLAVNMDKIASNTKDVVKEMKKLKSPLEDVDEKIKTLTTDITKLSNELASSVKTSVNTLNIIINGVNTVLSKTTKVLNTFFKGLGNGMEIFANSSSTMIKSLANNLISMMADAAEGMATALTNGVNDSITALNGLVSAYKRAKAEAYSDYLSTPKTKRQSSFSYPAIEVPSISNFIPSLDSIPMLAQGAVIPANKEFLAVLGDQTSGTNIEAPLDTIKQAVAEVFGEIGTNNNEPIVLQLNSKVIAKAVWDENEKRYKQTGKLAY